MSNIKGGILDSKSEAIQSFTVTELTTGKSFLRFYCTPITDDISTKYALSTTATHSEPAIYACQDNNADYTLEKDLDFDILINKPIQIEGTAIFTGAIGSTAAHIETAYHKIIVKIRKVPKGGSEEEIVNNTKSISQNVQSAGDTVSMLITIPKTKYAVGDILRITIEWWLKGNCPIFDPYIFFDSLTDGTIASYLKDTGAPGVGIATINNLSDRSTNIIIPYNPKD